MTFSENSSLKVEGHRIYISKTQRYQYLPERSPNVIFSQNLSKGPCKAIPLEQLTKIAMQSKYNRIKLQVVETVPRRWYSDQIRLDSALTDSLIHYPISPINIAYPLSDIPYPLSPIPFIHWMVMTAIESNCSIQLKTQAKHSTYI